MIPKKIYYAWFGGNELPEDVKINIASWKKYNPDYEIIQINESTLDLFNYQDYQFSKDAYKEKKWAFVSDVARLSAVYHNGGIYLDTDVKVLKSFDDLLNFPEIWAKENSYTINSGLFIASEVHSKNIKNILEIYKSLEFNEDNLAKISTVTIISKYFWEKGLQTDNKKIQYIENSVVYPTHFFAPIHYWGGGKVTKYAYTIHQYSASWLTMHHGFKESLRNIIRWMFNQLVLNNRVIGYVVAMIKYK
ncbi:glycosyltransferase [Leuconostoc fallax]|uniref:glycosyltransferase family 32 protein n=1 Tax=Leuconostoc fallax TaxID=1251 RepID=UPI002091B436|nr:glycosyltransferase [Leuconostoc fallax]MCO6183167.1 hypothetical protein [Leuconostoc fallax]